VIKSLHSDVKEQRRIRLLCLKRLLGLSIYFASARQITEFSVAIMLAISTVAIIRSNLLTDTYSVGTLTVCQYVSKAVPVTGLESIMCFL
jgi:hypothetical protein